MQATGIVNDHHRECDIHKIVQSKRKSFTSKILFFFQNISQLVTKKFLLLKNLRAFLIPPPVSKISSFSLTMLMFKLNIDLGTSYLNRNEAQNIEKMLAYFLKAGISPKQIGVVTPYEGQRSHIASILQRQTSLNGKMYHFVRI